MPTRLADGLGPESDPDEGSLRCSPHPRFTEELVPPRRLAGRQADLGCYAGTSTFMAKMSNARRCHARLTGTIGRSLALGWVMNPS
jgi:hypothetical protein